MHIWVEAVWSGQWSLRWNQQHKMFNSSLFFVKSITEIAFTSNFHSWYQGPWVCTSTFLLNHHHYFIFKYFVYDTMKILYHFFITCSNNVVHEYSNGKYVTKQLYDDWLNSGFSLKVPITLLIGLQMCQQGKLGNKVNIFSQHTY